MHVEATRAGAGVGLLACYMANKHSELVRIMPETINIRLSYWLVSRRDTLLRPEVAVIVRQLQHVVESMQGDLIA